MLARVPRALMRPASVAASSAAAAQTAMLPAALTARAVPAAIHGATSVRSMFTASRPLQFDAASTAAREEAAAAPLMADAALADTQRPVSTRVYSAATLRRQALAQVQPWYISHRELVRLRRGPCATGPAEVRLPWELRRHKPEFEMRRLRHLEASKLASDPQRTIVPFNPGDRIVVTKYVSLNDRTRFERVAGLVLARSRGDRLSASFLMRAHKLGEDYELRFPLWSPFIARIDMVQANPAGPNRRKKQYLLRDGLRADWETKVPQGLSKPTATPQTIEQRAKDAPGKVLVLAHAPMRKQIKEKRAGGLGAELAAAGGGDKKGAAAKAAPKKK